MAAQYFAAGKLDQSYAVTSPAPFLVRYRQRDPEIADIYLYIEGDGRAFAEPWQQSTDPSPRRPVALAMAASDPSANVVWLGRPCQYTPCDDFSKYGRYWAEDSYSDEIIDSYRQVVRFFARSHNRIHLIGHSGGAWLALKLAASEDVASLTTISGALDWPLILQHWAAAQKVDEQRRLSATELGKLALIPQRHFIGSRDEIIPAQSSREYFRKIRATAGSACMIVLDYAHHNWPTTLLQNAAPEYDCKKRQ